jgi:hypothetical protein
MQIADLDLVTRNVIYHAKRVHREATAEHLEDLGKSLANWDFEHRAELNRNLQEFATWLLTPELPGTDIDDNGRDADCD